MNTNSQREVPPTVKDPSRGLQICTNCVMDTTDADIVFDDVGRCDHCLTFARVVKPHWENQQRDKNRLDRIADEIRKVGKGRDFDCLVGVSGGTDSSYLIYLVKEVLGLRPLAFHTDAGWNSQEAVNNIERVVDGLGLDLFTHVIDWDEMRDLQLAFFKAGVRELDMPQDYGFFAAMYRFAAANRIRHIVTGANHATEAIRNPVNWQYYADDVYLRDIHRRFGTRKLEKYPRTHILYHKVYLPYVRKTRVVRLLNYLPYRKGEAQRILADKFGWQPYAQKHFESRFTRFLEGFWLPQRFGIDFRKVKLSNLILNGEMTRAAALEELRRPSLDEAAARREFEFVADKLGVSTTELQAYFDLPRRSYRDYRTQGWLYRSGASAMKIFGMEIGGKR